VTDSSNSRLEKRHQTGNYKLLSPLSPLTYFRRNIWRVLPVAGAILISVFLIAAIVTLLNSVDSTITHNYGSLRHYSVLTPQFERDIPQKVYEKSSKFENIDRILVGIPYFVPLKTVFGEMPVPVYGLDSADVPHFIIITGNKLVEGRLPQVNEAEIVLSRIWANNFHVKVGDKWKPSNERLPTLAEEQTVVGILEDGDAIAIADKAYLQLTLPDVVQRPSYLFLPTSEDKLYGLSQSLAELTKEPKKHGITEDEVRYVRAFTYAGLVTELRRSLGFLYTFLKIADILVIGAVALLSGFLANIYFEQRLGEFGLLSALGFRRERLAKRLIIETGAMVLVAWLVGIGMTALLFDLLDYIYMTPNGLTLATIGQDAFAYTVPIPFIVGIASLATVLSRLYRVDPIEIMERR
jgi:hypothetical protein